MSAEVRQSEDKAQRAMVEAASLAAELRAEQEGGAVLEGEARLLEAQVRDAASKLEEAERSALASGRKAAAKMEARVAELGAELDTETRRRAEAQKNLRRSERRVAELSCQQDEDRKNHERMQALVDQLQAKIKGYKKQLEEAEEIAALNLAKYCQVN